MLEASGHLTPLLMLGDRERGKPGWDVCADLWRNALRRGDRGRYDDAVARLYRLLEAVAQAQLWAKYRLESGRVAPSDLPDSMRTRALVKEDAKTGLPYAQLALHQTVELLRERDRNDPFVSAYAVGDTSHGPPWLGARNRSILAHGFARVTADDWSAACGWVQANLIPFFEKRLFPQLPNVIPLLQHS
jgi:CRISPR-associated protein (TIGR02710 family)